MKTVSFVGKGVGLIQSFTKPTMRMFQIDERLLALDFERTNEEGKRISAKVVFTDDDVEKLITVVGIFVNGKVIKELSTVGGNDSQITLLTAEQDETPYLIMIAESDSSPEHGVTIALDEDDAEKLYGCLIEYKD